MTKKIQYFLHDNDKLNLCDHIKNTLRIKGEIVSIIEGNNFIEIITDEFYSQVYNKNDVWLNINQKEEYTEFNISVAPF